MNFDDLQSKWQSHNHVDSIQVDTEQLLHDVRQKYVDMEKLLWQRDLAEIVAALMVTCFFGVLAIIMRDWSLVTCAAGGLIVGVFFVVDRMIQKRRRCVVENSLRSYIQASLDQVQHQIWLLRNILWWYLFPLIVGLSIFLGSLSWQSRNKGWAEQLVILVVGLICMFAFWQVYRINHREIAKSLEPRRSELESLLASIEK